MNDASWSFKEVRHVIIIVFVVAVAWATLSLQMLGVSRDVQELSGRTAKIEIFLVQQSKGQFVPQVNGSKQ